MALRDLAAEGVHHLDFLAGGYEMDEHFRSSPWAENLPVLMALAGIWNINFLQLPTLVVLPYDYRPKRFSASIPIGSNPSSLTRGHSTRSRTLSQSQASTSMALER